MKRRLVVTVILGALTLTACERVSTVTEFSGKLEVPRSSHRNWIERVPEQVAMPGKLHVIQATPWSAAIVSEDRRSATLAFLRGFPGCGEVERIDVAYDKGDNAKVTLFTGQLKTINGCRSVGIPSKTVVTFDRRVSEIFDGSRP